MAPQQTRLQQVWARKATPDAAANARHCPAHWQGGVKEVTACATASAWIRLVYQQDGPKASRG